MLWTSLRNTQTFGKSPRDFFKNDGLSSFQTTWMPSQTVTHSQQTAPLILYQRARVLSMNAKILIHIFAKMSHLWYSRRSLQCVQNFVKSVSDQVCSSDFLTWRSSLRLAMRCQRLSFIYVYFPSSDTSWEQSWPLFLSKVLPCWDEAQTCALNRKTLLGRSGSCQEDWSQDWRCYWHPGPAEWGECCKLLCYKSFIHAHA